MEDRYMHIEDVQELVKETAEVNFRLGQLDRNTSVGVAVATVAIAGVAAYAAGPGRKHLDKVRRKLAKWIAPTEPATQEPKAPGSKKPAASS